MGNILDTKKRNEEAFNKFVQVVRKLDKDPAKWNQKQRNVMIYALQHATDTSQISTIYMRLKNFCGYSDLDIILLTRYFQEQIKSTSTSNNEEDELNELM